MKSLSCNMFHVGIIQIIANEWKTKVAHVDPDLMGAACLQTEGDKAVPVFFIHDMVVCDRFFSIFKIYRPFNDRSGFAAKRRIDCAFGRCDRTFADSEVFPVDTPLLYHSG